MKGKLKVESGIGIVVGYEFGVDLWMGRYCGTYKVGRVETRK